MSPFETTADFLAEPRAADGEIHAVMLPAKTLAGTLADLLNQALPATDTPVAQICEGGMLSGYGASFYKRSTDYRFVFSRTSNPGGF